MSAASLYFLLGILSVIMTAFPSPANVAELTSSNFEWSAKTKNLTAALDSGGLYLCLVHIGGRKAGCQ